MSLKQSAENLYHSYSVEQTFKELDSNESGLSQEEADKRLFVLGFNEITTKEKVNPFLIFIKQFKSLLILILFFAAGFSLYYDKIIDFYVIMAVVCLNAVMGFIQEYRAEKAITALKNIIVPTAKVYRKGELLEIKARELVKGDVILLEEGDLVPADARIFEAKNLRTVESSLTGESSPVSKSIEAISEKVGMADKTNMVWLGTFIAGGQAKAVITSVGTETALGMIAEDISKIKKKKTHFEKKIDRLAFQMGLIALAGAGIIFLVGYYLKDIEFQEIMSFTIASLVSGIPEGLPAVLVIVLAIGASRMAKRNAIIRRLPATETLGVTTVISTDKTGTITQNTMNVREIVFSGTQKVEVTGNGWEPVGDFYRDQIKISPLENKALSKLLHVSAVCNNSRLIKKENEEHEIIGDPTEASLIVLAEKAGLRSDILGERKIDDLPFDSELKYRASLSALVKQENKNELFVVGAPEAVINRSVKMLDENGFKKELTEEKKKEIHQEIEILTKKAMRVLALAYKPLTLKHKALSDDIVEDLIFIGVVGMIDPPRPEVKEAVFKARKAGIRVIMTTGDHQGTAEAISREVGILDNQTGKVSLVESELLLMSEQEFSQAVREINVFARLTPHMKLRIAESLQKDGQVVAMTGDGVNDAPALKKADIGISMGIIGTDVARESSEIILADDNFASIVNAVEEGRIVFTNTRQSSTFLITTNFAEHATLIASLFLFAELPLLATQILWLNLVTDGVTGFALAAEPGHGEVLEEPPRKKNENILSKEIIPFLFFMTIVMAVLTLSFFAYHLFLDKDLDKARTAAFTVIAFTQLFNVLNMRSMKKSLFEIGFFLNKYIPLSLGVSIVLQLMAIYWFGSIFRFAHLSFKEIALIFFFSSFVLWFGELYKYLRYGRRRLEKINIL
jgi:P-type Ca2+ transporter type 2C